MGDQMTVLGYARVSTDGQTLDAQEASLKAAGATKIFAEKISGAVTDRKALAKAIAALGAGDVLLAACRTELNSFESGLYIDKNQTLN
jgi:DNA invertase Pin-like site-specific DNA recombinase